MMTIGEVNRLTGVSVRALQYYDKIGLLSPSVRTEAGYRLYGDESLERLQQILLFRALEFSLGEIAAILESPAFNRERALEQQIELLTLRRDHLDSLIAFARGLQKTGGNSMDFSAFDTGKMDEYARRAREQWQDTAAYAEFAGRDRGRSDDMRNALSAGLMTIFEDFGRLRSGDPASENAQALVRRLQAYITEHYYRCTSEILKGLGAMYAAGGEFTESIDAAGGQGTARFAARAIAAYCKHI